MSIYNQNNNNNYELPDACGWLSVVVAFLSCLDMYMYTYIHIYIHIYIYIISIFNHNNNTNY